MSSYDLCEQKVIRAILIIKTMNRQKELTDESPLDLEPLTVGTIIDLSLLAKDIDFTGHWLVMRPNNYVTMDLTTLSVDESYLTASGADRFVFFPDYSVAGRIKDILNRFNEGGLSSVTVGALYNMSDRRLGSPQKTLHLTEETLINNSLDPLNQDHQSILLGIFKKSAQKRAGVIPYTYVNNILHFFLAKNIEEPNWSSSGKWTDFGGAIELNELVEETAAREAFEEAMGFLGTYDELLEKLSGRRGFEYARCTSFSLKVPYNEGQYWPNLFSRVRQYMVPCFKENFLGVPCLASSPEGYFEKIEVGWFTLDHVNKNQYMFPRIFVKILNKMVHQNYFTR